jgi:hypothetical protein
MGRRRQSTAEDIVDLIALLPWWAGVVLAVVSYLILHRYRRARHGRTICAPVALLRGCPGVRRATQQAHGAGGAS